MRGRGGFWSDLKKGYKKFTTPFLDVVQAAADVWHPNAGRFMRKARPIVGVGAYDTVGADSLLASPVPVVGSAPDNGVRVKHTEYIMDISSTTALTNMVLNINPGMQTTFPWLSNLARSFQKWDAMAMIFTFKSTSATALGSTSTALGTIIGAVIYDVNAEVPQSKAGILGLSGSRAGVPSKDNLYPVECAPSSRLMRNLLVRSAGVSDDLQKYDLGKLLIATVGSQTDSIAGELHVSYDIVLKSPTLGGAIGSDLAQSHFHMAGVTTADELGTMTTYDNSLALTITAPSSGVLKLEFPVGSAGRYVIRYHNQSSTTVTTPAVSYGGVNNAPIDLFNGHSTDSMVTPTAGTTNATYEWVMAIEVDDPSLASSISFAGLVSAGTAWADLSVIAINYDY
jgi:hypothetical protein